jgi:tetratricopeptide (TPR) repeat protein
MPELPETTDHVPDRNARLDEAFAEIQDARERGELELIPVLLALYPDLRDELVALLEAEATFLGLARLPSGPDGIAGFGRLGDYEVLTPIARGGWGAVFRARHRFLGREVAIKLLHPRLADNPDAVTRFLEEAQIASQLEHPGIVPVHEVDRTESGQPYFVMKLVDGKTLAELLRERTSPADGLGRFLGIFLRVCETVAYAHRTKGVLHRDLKPLNIMVGAFGEVQVMDWGLGKVVHGAADGIPLRTLREDDPLLATRHGARIGTPAYMPPEQANGQLDRVGPHSDVFGLGAILCEILTGLPPYAGRERDKVDEMARSAALGPARARLEECGADRVLIALAQYCLASETGQRPTDAGEVAKSVATYLNGLQAEARRREMAQATLRWRLALAGLAVVMLAVGTLATAWYRVDQATRAAEAAREQAEAATRAAEARAGLEEVAAFIAQERWTDARGRLERIEGLLASGGPEELHARARAAHLDLEFVRDRERARQSLGFVDGGFFDEASIAPAYGGAFQRYGINLSAVHEAAARIRGSAIRGQLLATLDHWALAERQPMLRRPILEVAWAASDPSWARAFRDPDLRSNPGALARLAEKASPGRLSPVEIESLARVLASTQGDAEGLLRRGRNRFPGDFWLNVALAEAILRRAHPLPLSRQRRRLCEEAVGYARAALARDPESTYAFALLGRLLTQSERFAEAESAFQEALRRQPSLVPVYHAQARARLLRGDLRGAENTCNDALAFASSVAPLHELLGLILERQGRLGRARDAFARARELAPHSGPARLGLARVLLQQGRIADARQVCQEVLRFPPHEAEARSLLALLDSLDQFAAQRRTGQSLPPRTGEEQALAAEWCAIDGRPLAALGLFKEAFARDPTLPSRASRLFPPLSLRSLAARAAVLAAVGRGSNQVATDLDRPALVSEALAWLRQDFDSLQASADADQPGATTSLRAVCAVWLHDPNLAALRTPTASLLKGHQDGWQRFWAKVGHALRDGEDR